MVTNSYVPERGDLVWLDFHPQAGHEQKGRRPAVVLSPKSYNSKSLLAWVCPVTSKAKGYPFEVPLPEGLVVDGVILVDQLRSLDYRQRRAELIEKIPFDLCQKVLTRAKVLLS